MNRRLAAAGTLALSLVLGCSAETQRAGTSTSPSPGSETATTSAQQTTISVTPVDLAGYDAALARLRGKVVLVDFWATWCLPCVEQLPHTLELGGRLAGRGLSVVTVSCDDPAESARVAEFLQSKQAAHAVNLISQFGAGPKTMEEFEITTGAVPFYKLYDRTGRLRKTFGIDPALKTQFTPADIEAAIEQLLAE
jgi:thiol-disulfide isomerase/thioredoxin